MAGGRWSLGVVGSSVGSLVVDCLSLVAGRWVVGRWVEVGGKTCVVGRV